MIVGTAGHIDHGKTTLIRALTGIETDRLKEEKTRGISIELGFAYVPVPGGEVLGFVDVPGHERFVATMVAGASGIDFALIVIAADDGVMPQTREHLAVLDLLGIGDGVVALSKADLVDAERLEEVKAEIGETLVGTALAGIEIFPVSTVTGMGVETLKTRLLEEAASRPARPTRGRFRMAVDRSFTLPGAGTVVTGAVHSGSVIVGGRVCIFPSGEEVRVRSIHAQGREAEAGRAGERCALNLVGIARDAVARGDWLVAPGSVQGTARFDAAIRLLASEARELRIWTPVQLHVGASRVAARVVPLAADRLEPGGRGLVQIVPERPLPLVCGDRLILRDTSGARTVGGGHVVDPAAARRNRNSMAARARRSALALPDHGEALETLLALSPGLLDLDGFAEARGLSEAQEADVLALLEPSVFPVGGRRIAVRPEAVATLGQSVVPLVAAFHEAHPDLPGMPRAMLRREMVPRLIRPEFEVAMSVLEAAGVLVAEAGIVRLPSHRSRLGAGDQMLWERVSKALEAAGAHPPSLPDLAEGLNAPVGGVRKLCRLMARLGETAEVGKDRVFLTGTLEGLAKLVVEIASESPDGVVTVIGFRDRAGCGRGVAVMVLEYFDRRGLTVRKGNERVVVKTVREVFRCEVEG